VILKRYVFFTIGVIIGTNYNDTTPKTWTLDGSNDDSTWVQLDDASFTVDGTTNIQRFISDDLNTNTTAYSYYRINVATTNYVNNNLTSLSELALYEY
jgi:hypothetical protein